MPWLGACAKNGAQSSVIPRHHCAPLGFVPKMASAYLFHLVKNHPFVDGNKRTGLASALAFLGLNGFRLAATEDEVVEIVLAVAAGSASSPNSLSSLRRIFLRSDVRSGRQAPPSTLTAARCRCRVTWRTAP
ncbi:MAG: type II toxin-antitoxin system death-on-curing family toxin [Myxococcaceae bacterium]